MRRLGLALALLLALAAPAAAQYLGAPGTNVNALYQTGISAANTALTVTLPAVAGQFHYITNLELTHSCTAGVSGSALLTITTTNLGGLQWINGNLCNAGQEHIQLYTFQPPYKSAVAGTASTIVFPAMGVAAQSAINVYYFTGP
jgi:hypothetical protein